MAESLESSLRLSLAPFRLVTTDQTLSIYNCLFDFGLTNSLISDFRSDMLT